MDALSVKMAVTRQCGRSSFNLMLIGGALVVGMSTLLIPQDAVSNWKVNHGE